MTKVKDIDRTAWVTKLKVTPDERELIMQAAKAERMDIGSWLAKVAVRDAKKLASSK